MINLVGFGSVIDLAGKVIDKIFPNKDEANKAKLELMKLQQDGYLKELEFEFNNALKQIEVNIEEAKSEKWWKAGARPFVIWVCGFALAYNYILMPFIVFITSLFVSEMPKIPALDTSELMTLLLGLLGIAGMRSYDKRTIKSL